MLSIKLGGKRGGATVLEASSIIYENLKPYLRTTELVEKRCIADDQWAIDAFYKGYDKANADFKANGFTGLKPIIGGIRSLVYACKPERESGEAPITKEWIEAVISDEVYSDQGDVCGALKAADIIFNRIEGELI